MDPCKPDHESANTTNQNTNPCQISSSSDHGTFPKRPRISSDQELTTSDQSIYTDNQSGSIWKIPVHILALIFKLIPISQWPSLAKVNRQFQGAVNQVWHEIREIRLDDFRLYKHLMEQNRWVFLADVLEKIGNRSPNISSISGFSAIIPRVSYALQENDPISSLAIQKLAAFEHLESVDFSNCELYSKELNQFFRSSASRETLKHVDLWNCYSGYSSELSSVEFRNDDDLLKLETLVVGTPLCISFLDNQEFSLPFLTTFKAIGTENPANLLAAFLNRSIHLKHLEFNFVRPNFNPPPQGQPVVLEPECQAVMDAISALKDLSILKISFPYGQRQCPQLQSALTDLIISLGQRRVLTSFGLENWTKFCDETVLTIGQHLTHLTSLEIPLKTRRRTPIKYLLGNLISLENLRLKYKALDGKVMKAMIAALAANQGGLKCLYLEDPPPQPWMVSLVAASTNAQPPQVDPEILNFDDLRLLNNLKELRIQDSRLTDSALESWADGFTPNLEELELIGCKKITSIGLVPLIQHLPMIRRLVIKDSKIKDAVLSIIAAYCSNLEYLELSVVKKTTSACIQSIIDHCKFLKVVKITSDCWVYSNRLEVPKYRNICVEWSRKW